MYNKPIFLTLFLALTALAFPTLSFASKTPTGTTAVKPSATPKSGTLPATIVTTDRLDTAAVHKLYLDGDFDPAIAILERAKKENRLKSHEDSVFAFKHLGVMYAANYGTIEKGKQHMFLLLSVEPSVRIMDMYASDMIYMIFKNVQEEFVISHTRLKPDNGAKPLPDSARINPHPTISSRTVWPYWTAGAVALVGVGATTYFLFNHSASPGTHYEGGL